MGTATSIIAYWVSLSPFTSFKYLGRFLLSLEGGFPAVLHNLRWARQKCVRLSMVLVREGADARTLGIIYMEMVQAVMLYGSEMWVMTPRIGGLLR